MYNFFSGRLRSYLDWWIDMATIAKPFEDVYDLMMRDQVFRIISQYLRLSLKKRIPYDLKKMEYFANQFRHTRNVEYSPHSR